MRLGILSDVHGNRIALEAVLADGQAGGVDAWWALGDLVALPLEVRLELEHGTRVLGVHASPGRDDGERIRPDRPEEDLAAALADADADIVVAGHTHRATDRTVGAVRAVNPGSVSNPVTDDLRAGYVIVHSDRSGHGVEHRRVDYDRGAFLDRLRESGHPAHDYLATMFRWGG